MNCTLIKLIQLETKKKIQCLKNIRIIERKIKKAIIKIIDNVLADNVDSKKQ